MSNKLKKTKKSLPVTLVALFVTLAIPALMFVLLGWIVGLMHLVGFLGGFTIWLLRPTTTPWAKIKIPYFLILVLFIFHRIDEEVSGFFTALEEITGVPLPELTDLTGLSLIAGAAMIILVLAWVLSPILIRWRHPLGYFGAWSFFFAAGVLELAHFVVFPFLRQEPFGYFPGMISVAFLAPAAWWGMWRLYKIR